MLRVNYDVCCHVGVRSGNNPTAFAQAPGRGGVSRAGGRDAWDFHGDGCGRRRRSMCRVSAMPFNQVGRVSAAHRSDRTRLLVYWDMSAPVDVEVVSQSCRVGGDPADGLGIQPQVEGNCIRFHLTRRNNSPWK